jgi:hypothetical protein
MADSDYDVLTAGAGPAATRRIGLPVAGCGWPCWTGRSFRAKVCGDGLSAKRLARLEPLPDSIHKTFTGAWITDDLGCRK